MQPDTAYEIVSFLTRDELECCQLTSRAMDVMIRDSTTLALRNVDSVLTVSYMAN